MRRLEVKYRPRSILSQETFHLLEPGWSPKDIEPTLLTTMTISHSCSCFYPLDGDGISVLILIERGEQRVPYDCEFVAGIFFHRQKRGTLVGFSSIGLFHT